MLRSELWERIQLCPAFGLKYVEVSCRTNHEVARMERMLLLGLRQLPSLAQIREGQAGGAKGKKGKRKQVAQDKAQELLAAVGLAGVGAFFASLGGETAAGPLQPAAGGAPAPGAPGEEGAESEGEESEEGEEDGEEEGEEGQEEGEV